ncbi:unknown [Clostridium sp. CAG:433]|nr:unknown [Clostridium sp. CAG:433]
MKRLLRISFDLSLLSFIPIILWFLLGIIVDKNLINIFTLTYPLQFIYYIFRSVFSTGANISKEKDKNKDAVMSGLVIGSIISLITFLLILINIDGYINFMNMDVNIYKTFTIYSVIEIFISLEFAFILNKLYYEGQNKLANKYSIMFNLLNLVLLVGTSLITKNQSVIVITTLIPLFLFTLYIIIKNSDKFKLKLNIPKCIKYDSVELFNNIGFLLIFLFGLSNAINFGEKYTLALTFVALITDTQWDTADAIVTAATIDISKNNFNYKEHKRNAYKLLGILFLTSLIMFSLLYRFYDLDFKITMIYFAFEIVNFLIYPIYRIKTCYLQLEWSSFKTTGNKIFSLFLRMILSLTKTPFCTGIGQACSSVYQFITVSIFFKLNFKVDKKGNVIRKKME